VVSISLMSDHFADLLTTVSRVLESCGTCIEWGRAVIYTYIPDPRMAIQHYNNGGVVHLREEVKPVTVMGVKRGSQLGGEPGANER